MQAAAPLVSIVVACRNERRHISAFLDSLLGQDLEPGSWEAIIADGQSEDGTREILDSCCAANPHIRWIDNRRHFVAPGLNTAIRSARGEFIVRMDAHTVYPPSYCRLCVGTLIATGADNVGGPARTRAAGWRARAIAAAFHSPFSTGGAKFHNPAYEGWVDTLPYGCWRKSTLQKLGGFDESLVRNQDDELNLRLVRAGGRLWQSPAIESWYSPRAGFASLFRQYFQYGFWKVAVIRKHRLPASWRHLVPICFVAAQVLALAILVAAALTGRWHLFSLSFIVCLAAFAFYSLATVIASVSAARRQGWDALVFLPAAFLTFHYSYGLGFAAGLAWFSASDTRRVANLAFSAHAGKSSGGRSAQSL